MKTSSMQAKRLLEVILNGKWVANTNVKDQLSSVGLEKALAKFGELNSLAALTFHLNYYIEGVLHFFEKGSLDIRDKYSFDLPSIKSEQEWIALKESLFANTEKLSKHIALLSEDELEETFVDEKYGNYRRNMEGIIEHCYYHLGQIVILNKLMEKPNN